MKNIETINAARSFAGPGVYGYDAEAKVVDVTGGMVYVHVNVYDDFKHYTVSNESTFGAMTENGEIDDDFEIPNCTDPDYDKKMEEFLPSNFMRIHRSYIVNLDKVQEVNKNRVILARKDGENDDVYLPIGENYKEQFNEYLSSRFLGK